MSESLHALARLGGIAVDWTDVYGAHRRVADDTLLRLLRGLDLACDTPGEIADSIAALAQPAALPPLLTADAGQEIVLALPDGLQPEEVEIDLPSGTVPLALDIRHDGGLRRAAFTAPMLPGYHPLRIGRAQTMLAVAPPRSRSVAELTGRPRAYGAAVQIYGLPRSGDGGIGDFAALGEAAQALAARGADALAISPTHALFTAEPGRPSPYAPSSRLVLNPLLADPGCRFDAAAIAAAWAQVDPQGLRAGYEQASLIDWAPAGHAKLAMLRRLFDGMAPGDANAAAFAEYERQARPDVRGHAAFEALHAHLRATTGEWHWRHWPVDLRRPDSPAVHAFAAEYRQEVAFQVFLQWLAELSLDQAQARARAAGMGIGLVADLAVGMDPSGSHAWSRPEDVLAGLTIGAPPDLFNPAGQGWALTTFAPTALTASGFGPFLATLRAALRHAGGVRIDHVMGLRRLWLIPDGSPPTQGAYLDYPLEDCLRLIALESHLADALVVGEDLGTVPYGFRPQLAARGVLGMRVLPFERQDDGGFLPPPAWQPDALAMTSTHDLAPIAGWWRSRDLAWRARLRGEPASDHPAGSEERRADCMRFWQAACWAGVAEGPAPEADAPERAVDAAVAYVAASPCALTIVPVEDLLGLEEGPNLPGTVDEHPNWRRRLDAPLPQALGAPQVETRLEVLRRAVR